MVSTTYTSAILLSAAMALAASSDSAVSAFKQLGTDTATLDKDIQAFQQSQGINGALSIQTDSTKVLNDVQAVTKALGSVDQSSQSDGAAVVQAALSVLSSVTQALKDITSKASAFSAVGAGQIVTGDINQLQSATSDLEKAFYAQVNCAVVGSATSGFAAVNTGFASAASAFSASSQAWPGNPTTCAGGSGSSAAASSAAPSSAAASSAAASSAPASSAAASSAPASSAAASSAPATTVAQASSAAATTAAAASSTGVAQSNSGVKVAVGGLGVVAAAAFLL